MIVSVVPAGADAADGGSAAPSDAMDETGADDSHKSRPEPVHLS